MKKYKKLFFIGICVSIIGIVLIKEFTYVRPVIQNVFAKSGVFGSPGSVSLGFDEKLYACVIDNYNELTSSNLTVNNVLTEEQLSKITDLRCENREIQNLDGIGKLKNLTSLNLNHNKLTSIDLSQFLNLKTLDLQSNMLTSIDLSYTPNLTDLNLNYNQLTSIDLSHQLELNKLYLKNNKLTSIDLSHNPKLTNFHISKNQLTNIDLSCNSKLKELSISYNKLTNIDLTHNTSLELFYSDDSIHNIIFSNSIVDEVNNIIKNISPKTTPQSLIDKNKLNYNLSFQKNVTDSLGTGDVLYSQIKGAGVVFVYTISVKGDIDGDSKVSAVDYVLIKKHIMKTTEIKDKVKYYAADTDSDDKITAVDYAKVKQYIMDNGVGL